MEKSYLPIGNRIKSIRKLYRLNQTKFADNIGISQGNLSEIESGKVLPSLETIIRLGQKYELDLNWLMKGTASPIAPQLYKNEEALFYSFRQLEDVAKEEVLEFIELKLKRFKKQ